LWLIKTSTTDYADAFAVTWGTSGDHPVRFILNSLSTYTIYGVVQWGSHAESDVPIRER
jgi:hypothetical protein